MKDYNIIHGEVIEKLKFIEESSIDVDINSINLTKKRIKETFKSE